jgi:hypothetical protein
MASLIVSLTLSVFVCGAIGYLRWLQWFGSALQSDSKAVAGHTSTRSYSSRWRERLLMFAAGGCLACFCFAVNLSGYLSPGNRPAVPEVSLGQTHFFGSKYGSVYVTNFEYLAVTYGLWFGLGGLIVIAMIAKMLKTDFRGGSNIYPLALFAGLVTSMLLYCAIWQASLYLEGFRRRFLLGSILFDGNFLPQVSAAQRFESEPVIGPRFVQARVAGHEQE